jgi:tripartite ATP-independent transporter DctM subunit
MRVWSVLLLFAFIIGGMYFGLFTPTEAAGIGAFFGFVGALVRRTLTWPALLEVLIESAKTASVILILLIGALIFSNFLDIAGLPKALAQWLGGGTLPPLGVMVMIIAIYLVLGCILDSMSMMFLTVPLFFPIVTGLGYDAIWFGIIVVTMIEISLITPPVGLNVFVLHTVRPDISTPTIFKGVLPFVGADVVRVALLIAFPSIALVLPRLMG